MVHFLHCVLFNVYDARNDVLLWWIGPTNCQPKWLWTRSAEIQHEKKYFDCWSYHAARWIVNETTWKTVPKQWKSVFWKPNRRNRLFGFWILLYFALGLELSIRTDIHTFIAYRCSNIYYILWWILGRKRGATSKGCKSRMSASTMEALRLFHERAVAVSQMSASSLHGTVVTSLINHYMFEGFCKHRCCARFSFVLRPTGWLKIRCPTGLISAW